MTTFAALFFTRHLTSQVEAAEPVHTPNSWGMLSNKARKPDQTHTFVAQTNLSEKHVLTLYRPNSPALTGGPSTVIRISQKTMLFGIQ